MDAAASSGSDASGAAGEGGTRRKRRSRWDDPPDLGREGARPNRWSATLPAAASAAEQQLAESAARAVAEGGEGAEAALRQNAAFAAVFAVASPVYEFYQQRLAVHRAVVEARAKIALPVSPAVQTTASGGVIMPSSGSVGRVFYPPPESGLKPCIAPRVQLPGPPEGGGFTVAPGGVGRVFYPPPDAYPPPEPAPPLPEAPSERPRKRRSFREEAPGRPVTELAAQDAHPAAAPVASAPLTRAAPHCMPPPIPSVYASASQPPRSQEPPSMHDPLTAPDGTRSAGCETSVRPGLGTSTASAVDDPYQAFRQRMARQDASRFNSGMR
eukprot:scaffold322772_cov32-Tisochrysis_lutea.AAC.1